MDNPPGEVNLSENWGNYLLIHIGGGLYVLLAHLRQGSIGVALGQSVVPGTLLGRCGNSGRSAQPHLHLHVQRGWWLGAPTVPFHLTHCLINSDEHALDAHPIEGQSIESALGEADFAQACTTHPGRNWQFNSAACAWRLSAETGLLGETVLTSSAGGRVQAICGNSLLALHQRGGASEVLLDAFVLAFGLTPFAMQARRWHDAADASLLPLSARQRLGLLLRHPFGANLDSHYVRNWDAGRGLWQQRASHRVSSVFGAIEAQSIGWLSESQGPVAFSLTVNGRNVADATLVGFGNRGDHGVPAWSATYLEPAFS
jgi:hypothetical protein